MIFTMGNTCATNTAACSRLQVHVIDLLKVLVLDGQSDLEEVQHSLSLVQLCLLGDLVKKLPGLCQHQHNEQEIGPADHILAVHDTLVVHRVKATYFVQHVGGAVAGVEGCDNIELTGELACNPMQV